MRIESRIYHYTDLASLMKTNSYTTLRFSFAFYWEILSAMAISRQLKVLAE